MVSPCALRVTFNDSGARTIIAPKNIMSKYSRVNVILFSLEPISLKSSSEKFKPHKVTKIDITILFSSINGKNSIVGATKKNISLDISSIVTQISKLYGGGASKDPNLSIGGGPNNFDTENALKIAKETLLKES